MRSPVQLVSPPPPIWVACELSNWRPRDEKLASLWSRLPAATEITHGDSENGLRLISAGPLLPAAKTTVTPWDATARVITATGSFGSNCRNELPQELLTTLMPQRSGWL